jgi:hypothetical protein
MYAKQVVHAEDHSVAVGRARLIGDRIEISGPGDEADFIKYGISGWGRLRIARENGRTGPVIPGELPA